MIKHGYLVNKYTGAVVSQARAERFTPGKSYTLEDYVFIGHFIDYTYAMKHLHKIGYLRIYEKWDNGIMGYRYYIEGTEPSESRLFGWYRRLYRYAEAGSLQNIIDGWEAVDHGKI